MNALLAALPCSSRPGASAMLVAGRPARHGDARSVETQRHHRKVATTRDKGTGGGQPLNTAGGKHHKGGNRPQGKPTRQQLRLRHQAGGQRRLRLRRGPIYIFLTHCSREKNFLIPAAAGFFSLNATSGLLATRRRVNPICMYEEFTKKKAAKSNGQWPTTQFLFGASAAGRHTGAATAPSLSPTLTRSSTTRSVRTAARLEVLKVGKRGLAHSVQGRRARARAHNLRAREQQFTGRSQTLATASRGGAQGTVRRAGLGGQGKVGRWRGCC